MNGPKSFDELMDPDLTKPDPRDSFLDERQSTVNPKQLKEKAVSDKARALQDENDIRAIVATPQGVRFVVRLFERCGYKQPYFHPHNGNMSEIAGRRQVALDLENWIRDADYALWLGVDAEWEDRRPKPKTSQRSASKTVNVRVEPR